MILDDRNAGFGFKAKDWELVGIPFQIIVGREASNNVVEFKTRATNEMETITPEEAVARILAL